MVAASILVPPHPFYPPELKMTGYIANEWSMTKLLTVFFGSITIFLGATIFLINSYRPRLDTKDKLCFVWFILTGTIHFFFEGYFAVNHYRMPSQQDLFGQLWKEYAYSDSRYMSSDPFVLCMESITAICWGPLSYLTAYYIFTDSPYRFPIQAVVSLGQIYGDVLYYLTNTFDLLFVGVSYSRPEFVYFWFYYVFINSFWILIPGMLLYSSITNTAEAFKVERHTSKRITANGSTKKRN